MKHAGTMTTIAAATTMVMLSYLPNPLKINSKDIQKLNPKEVTEYFSRQINLKEAINYDNKYSEDKQKQIEKFRDILLKKRPQDSTYIKELFSMPELNIEPGIDSLINGLHEKVIDPWDYEKYKKYYGIDWIAENAQNYFDKHKQVLFKNFKETGVDPRFAVAVMGKETYFGMLPKVFKGKQVWYPWFNAILSRYTESGKKSWRSSKRHKSGAIESAAALIELATEVWNLSPRKLFEEQSSYAGAHNLMQFMPETYLKLAKGDNELISWDKLQHEEHLIGLIFKYAADDRFGRWNPTYNGRRGNENVALRYNYSGLYKKDINETIMPAMQYMSEKEMERYVNGLKIRPLKEVHALQEWRELKEPEIKEKENVLVHPVE